MRQLRKIVLVYGAYLAFLGFLLAPSLARADGKVAKQKDCLVLIEGMKEGAVGDIVPLLGPDGKEYKAKLVKVIAPKAHAQVQAKQCPNLVTATVGKPSAGGGKGGKKQEDAEAATTKDGAAAATKDGAKKFVVGAKTLVGFSMFTLAKQEGDTKEINYSGLDFMVGGLFGLKVGAATIPVELGVSRFSNAVIINSQEELAGQTAAIKYTQTATSLFLHFGSGVGMHFGAIGLSSILFLDYGLSGDLATTGDYVSKVKLDKSMRYGVDLGVDYKIIAGFKAGLDFTYFMGSITMNKTGTFSGTTGDVANVGPFKFRGFGGFLKLAYEI